MLLDNYQYHVRPQDWTTTPAEADVIPGRPRKAHFGGSEVVATFEPWYLDTWGDIEEIVDPATEQDDDLEILAHDLRMLSVESAPPPPASSNFDAIWQQLAAQGFDNEDEDIGDPIQLSNDSAEAEAIKPQPPATGDFHSIFDKLMAEGFDDDEDF